LALLHQLDPSLVFPVGKDVIVYGAEHYVSLKIVDSLESLVNVDRSQLKTILVCSSGEPKFIRDNCDVVLDENHFMFNYVMWVLENFHPSGQDVLNDFLGVDRGTFVFGTK
jgi:hypothetical protein